MDIIKYSQELTLRMQKRIGELDALKDDVSVIGQRVSCLEEFLLELKHFAGSYQFQNEAEEIQFFKTVKPGIISEWLYCKKVFALRVFDAYRDVEERKTNYHRKLRRMERYLQKHLALYGYYLSGMTHFDRQYFTRKGQYPGSVNRDDKFTTYHGIKLAKLLANERIRAFVHSLLVMSEEQPTYELSGSLTWTGSKTDLVELIYALHSVEVFNRGAAPIKQIASAFEGLFQIDLGDYYRTFQDMRIRKKSQTPFLDQLIERFEERLNEMDR